ncbi:signal recognition particle receptor subunit alpha [Betaproteobacteria bacterium]|nr:signal recognition particle receptor subunit alpha [Betaproteobacteria bacterium]
MSNSFDKTETTQKTSIWDSLKKIRSQVQEVFAGDHIDTSTLMDLEEILILSDTGPRVAAEITKEISARMRDTNKPHGGKESTAILREIIKEKIE